MFSVLQNTGFVRSGLLYEKIIFPGGEVQVRFYNSDKIDLTSRASYEVTAHITSANEIMELLLVTDALRRLVGPQAYAVLNLPYIPYARQDRVMEAGEALSIAVMARLINELKYDRVNVGDAHSPVALALINNVHNISQEALLAPLWVSRVFRNGIVLVAPDAGAQKKVMDVAKCYEISMITAEKQRNVHTGAITGTVVHSTEHIGDRDFLIVDDICDGGKTFIELAKVLRPLTNGKVLLYVTHGIFSKGLEVFKGIIDHIYVARPFPSVDMNDPIITQVGG